MTKRENKFSQPYNQEITVLNILLNAFLYFQYSLLIYLFILFIYRNRIMSDIVFTQQSVVNTFLDQ